MTIITQSEKQTLNLGKKIALELKGGEVIGFIGELGTGKTVFIKGLAQGLNIKNIITSPTFVLMKVYKTKGVIKQLCHVDAYRLNSSQDLIDIGIKDYLSKKTAVTVIEWANQVKNILPKNKILVKIKFGKKQNQRILEIIK